MKKIGLFLVICWLVSNFVWGIGLFADPGKNWPQWRGPQATGVAPFADPPVEWSETRNVRWKIEVPGKGHATPIVWGDRIFILTAVETGDRVDIPEEAEPVRRRRGPPKVKPTSVIRFSILAVDRRNGHILWQRTAREEFPHEGTHPAGSWASNSPVTDGEHVFAYFGSRGLYCYDLEGNLRWEKDFGKMKTRMGFGEGSSPVLYRDKIIINWDQEGQSFIAVLDKNTGAEFWRVDRDERTSWSTPLVLRHNGQDQVITSATNRVRSYDLATGEVIWECGGMTLNVIPSPVSAGDLVYVASGFRGNALLAIRLSEARGDITDSEAIVWKHSEDTPYTPSLLLYGDALYFLKRNNGILSCFDAKTGDEFFSRQRLDGIEGVFASPVGASDRVYIVGRNGMCLVIRRGRRYEVLSRNTLDDSFTASPAIAGDALYLRGHKTLYCIAKDSDLFGDCGHTKKQYIL